LQRRRVQIEFTPAATALLARRGKDSSEGAGVLQRLFVREVEDRLAQAMLEGRLQEGDSADFDVDGTELTLVVKR
jgi:ATP-dependent Clp protease ATP-binding subunit ClpA